MEELSSMKPSPGAKKVGGRCFMVIEIYFIPINIDFRFFFFLIQYDEWKLVLGSNLSRVVGSDEDQGKSGSPCLIEIPSHVIRTSCMAQETLLNTL